MPKLQKLSIPAVKVLDFGGRVYELFDHLSVRDGLSRIL